MGETEGTVIRWMRVTLSESVLWLECNGSGLAGPGVYESERPTEEPEHG